MPKGDITLCILIASGWERPEIPAVQAERLDFLLTSILAINDPPDVRVIVCDDFSENKSGQDECRRVCSKFGVEYFIKPYPWKGPCGNYNFAVSLCNTEFIAMLGDDQFCTPGWWRYMTYFIEHNKDLKWGMLGWSVIFAEDLVKIGFFDRREDFYNFKQKIFSLQFSNLDRKIIDGKWCNWDRPRFRGCCSGTAFVIRKSLWKQFGGFYEELYQFDEDYGDNVWNLTDYYCIQVPTPPIIHYGGACNWPPEKGPSDERWRKGWETRPFVPVKFEERGRKAAEKINSIGDSALAGINFKPLVLERSDKKYHILDLGCGKNKRHPEAIGIDIVGKPVTDADIICNLGFDYLPFPNDSCSLVMAHDVLEHIPHTVWIMDRGVIKRLQPTVFLFNEVYRVLRNGGRFEMAVPVEDTARFQDPTHASVWNYKTFDYFSNTYEGFKEAYGHTSNFKLIKREIDGQHLHVLLEAVK